MYIHINDNHFIYNCIYFIFLFFSHHFIFDILEELKSKKSISSSQFVSLLYVVRLSTSICLLINLNSCAVRLFN